jgi:hypothetical protein
LGILGSVLAAVAGVAVLTELLGRTPAGWIAIASAITTALALFLKSDEKRREHADLAAAWDNLRDAITVAYTTRPVSSAPDRDPDGWKDILDKVQARASDLRASKLDGDKPVPRWATTPVNGQFEVPAGGQLKVSTLRGCC